MKIIYNIGIITAKYLLKIVALFNSKIKLGVLGRKETFKILDNSLQPSDKTLWFHCASLGEYEQGLPVFSALRNLYPKHKIVLTFFSPSGYEIRKNTPVADVVTYLPLDTPGNAKRFITQVNPELSVFVKYDIWPNFLLELKKRDLNAILISALFRKQQSYFKFYGGFMRQALFGFKHVFTQNEASKLLLESINYTNVSISGDTRFDRVSNQLKTDNTLPFIETFKQDNLCLVAGSTWPEDEVYLTAYINTTEHKNLKFIIAPHNIKSQQINQLKSGLQVKSILYSEMDAQSLASAKVLIIDTIGLLTKIYNYADIAYVGGAAGTTGLHNTLEPAVFGVPIIIGKHYEKFPEAQYMITNKSMFSISSQTELNSIIDLLISDSNLRAQTGKANAEFIKNNQGAVIHITNFLRKYF
ncbi:3-deoxy-D-manno-octulosonic acid transferase [Formosa sp. S-31]|uniref:3-deoxy-D-manno-octulosonic acid transferase n=1 Tax=Formosa sp. S-31 TaxID=2790949 RepID=UPI003EBD0A95